MKFLSIGAVIVFFFIVMNCAAGCGNKFIPPNKAPVQQEADTGKVDVLKMIYTMADEKGMKVICDLNMSGGELYRKHSAEYVEAQYAAYTRAFFKRYGMYRSFWGWYLNNELNPLKPDEKTVSAFWRTVWKAAVTHCKKVAPKSIVTISPFFIMDTEKHRGYDYLPPSDYEQWWAQTLAETGIDVLMLQDSGAEHLGFFALDGRRPFFQAFKNACDKAGKKFWLNVETGEVNARDWKEAVEMEQTKTRKWVYTKTPWLAQKLQLAAEYGENIINWGYYPFMNSIKEAGPWPSGEVDGQSISFAGQQKAYADYKAYADQQLDADKPAGALTKPLMRGTLWWLPVNYTGRSREDVEKLIRTQIEKQAALGFDMLWIVNAPSNMEYAMGNNK